MTPEFASYHRHRFPVEIISHAVWLYHVFSLSLRDVELILAERGIVVTHESIRHWCLKFGSDFARRLRRRRPQPVSRTCLTIGPSKPACRSGLQTAVSCCSSNGCGGERYGQKA
jgi:transposase-like protein